MEPPTEPDSSTNASEHQRGTMKAVVQDVYGPPEILELREVAIPVPAADQVLVRVHAAGVDRGVAHLVTGLPYPLRLAGYGLRRPKAAVPGMDLAGRVEAVGPDVTGFRTGDEVFGIGTGTFAEYACAPAAKLAHKPADLTFVQAAAIAISGLTALQAARDHGRVAAGQAVLILGASGGVGTFAVQVAKAFGAEVTGVCSTAKVDLVRSIGADHVVDYTREDVTRLGRRYDVVLDIGGNTSLSRLRRVLTPRGRLVIVGGERTDGGWAARIANFARSRCPPSRVGRCARSSRRRTAPTCACSATSSSRAMSHRSSTGRTRWARQSRPSVASSTGRRAERS
jgi:NADPH:quinone reductase-like Zn-dependent oxidoreductase